MATLRDKLATAQQAVASGFTAEGYEVRFDAEKGPHIDLDNKIMHLTPLPEKLTKTDAEDVRGACDHEMGHALFTDPNAARGITDNFERGIINAIEDGRIEAEMSSRWLGVSENLEMSEKRVLKKLRALAKADTSEEFRAARAIAALALLAKGKSVAQAARAVGGDTKPILDRIAPALGGIDSLGSTKEAVDMGVAVARILREDSPSGGGGGEGNEEGEGNGEEGEEGGEGEGSKGDGKESGQCSSGRSGEGQEDGQGGQDSDEEGESEGESGKGSGGDGEQEKDGEGSEADGDGESSEDGSEGSDGDSDDGEQGSGGMSSERRGYGASECQDIADKLSETAVAEIRRDMIAGKKFEYPDRWYADTQFDQYTTLDASVDHETRDRFYDELRQLVPILRRKIQMEFQAPVKTYQRRKKKGKIDGRSLWKVGLGTERVFKRRMPMPDVNSDMTLLIDISGSMAGRQARLAAQSAAAYSQVLDLIGVRHEVLAFSTEESADSSHPVCRDVRRDKFDRVTPLHHITVKPVDKSFHACQDNFVQLAESVNLMQNNIDGEAVLWAAQRLCSFQEEGSKKAMMVFSDGYPNSSSEDLKKMRGHLKDTVKMIEAAGIPIVGVGVMSRSVRAFYENHVTVDNVDELGGECLKVLRDLLRKNVVTV